MATAYADKFQQGLTGEQPIPESMPAPLPGQPAPAPGEDYNKGRTGHRILNAVMGFGAGLTGTGPEFLERLDKNRQEAMIKDMVLVDDALADGRVSDAREALLDRLKEIKRLGGNPRHTIHVLNQLDSGDFKGAKSYVRDGLDNAVRQGMLEPRQVDRTVTSQNQLLEFEGEGGEMKITDLPLRKDTGGSSGYVWGDSDLAVDKDGNQFHVARKGDKAGGISESDVTPVLGPDMQAQTPTSKLTILQRGQTPAQIVTHEGRVQSAKTEAEKDAEDTVAAKREGLAARDQMRNVNQMLTLLEKVETGGLTQYRQAIANFLNLKDPTTVTLGQLEQGFGDQVMVALNNMKGPATEREREYLERIKANIRKGTAVNRAMLQDVRAIAENKFKRGQWLQQNPGASVYDSFLQYGDDNFDQQQEPQPDQPTAAPALPAQQTAAPATPAAPAAPAVPAAAPTTGGKTFEERKASYLQPGTP